MSLYYSEMRATSLYTAGIAQLVFRIGRGIVKNDLIVRKSVAAEVILSCAFYGRSVQDIQRQKRRTLFAESAAVLIMHKTFGQTQPGVLTPAAGWQDAMSLFEVSSRVNEQERE